MSLQSGRARLLPDLVQAEVIDISATESHHQPHLCSNSCIIRSDSAKKSINMNASHISSHLVENALWKSQTMVTFRDTFTQTHASF